MNWKKCLALLLAAVLTLALAACGPATNEATTPSESNAPSEGSTPGESTGDETAPAAGSKHVENLVVGITGSNDTFNLASQSGAFGRMNYNNVANAYFAYTNSENEIKPYFLTSYEISEDGKELYITFPLDKVWHDGQPVTAEDVQFTFEYYRDVSKNSYIKSLESIEVTGENSMTLKFSKADAYSYMANGATSQSVLPKHIWEKVDAPSDYAAEDAAIGCGPYKLVSYDLDAGTSYYEAVPQNSYLGELTVDALTVRTYSSQDALLMALLNGEIDAIYDYANPVSYTLLDLISGDSNIDTGESAYTGNYQVCFGMEEGRVFTDKAAREALVKCLDWNLLCNVINGPYGQIPGSGVITPACKGFDGSLWTFYQDVDEAKKILDDAGYLDVNGDGLREKPDGSELSVKVTPQYTSKKQELLNRIADVIIDSLKNVGVSAYMDTESLQSSEIWEANMVDGNYDMNIGYTTSGVAQYRTAFRYFVADVLPDDTENTAGSTWIWGTNHDPKLTEETWGITYTASEAEYLEHVKNLQKMASEDLFAFALCWERAFFPYRTDKYEGFSNWNSWGVINTETWYHVTAK